jgi:hypothetical protein
MRILLLKTVLLIIINYYLLKFASHITLQVFKLVLRNYDLDITRIGLLLCKCPDCNDVQAMREPRRAQDIIRRPRRSQHGT